MSNTLLQEFADLIGIVDKMDLETFLKDKIYKYKIEEESLYDMEQT